MTRRALAVLALLAAAVSPDAEASAAGPAECGGARNAVAGLRGNPPVRVLPASCGFDVACSPDATGGCRWIVAVAAEGTGWVEAEIASGFGVQRCNVVPSLGACGVESEVHVARGFADAVECSATGLAATARFACSVRPAP